MTTNRRSRRLNEQPPWERRRTRAGAAPIPRVIAVAIALAMPGIAGGEPTPPPAAPPPQAEVSGPVRRLTFDEAIRVAIESNPGLRAAEEDRQRAENRVGEAKAGTRPQVNAEGRVVVQGPIESFEIPMGNTTQTVVLSRRTTRVGRFSATWDTDLSGR